MKYLITVMLCCISLISSAQNTDSLVSLIYKEKAPSARIGRFYDVFHGFGAIQPIKAIEVQKQILARAIQKKDRVTESVVKSELGYLFLLAGSPVQGKRLELEALKLAEETGNSQAIGIAYQNLGVHEPDHLKSRNLQQKALKYSTQAGDHNFISVEMLQLARFYTIPQYQQLDSALYYAEKGYRISVLKNYIPMPPPYCWYYHAFTEN